jgi:hypothetical protein
VYFGLSAGMQTLYVSVFGLALLRNEFTSCAVLNSPGGGNGNAYGGGVSVYMGAYSTPNLGIGAGNTMVQNVSIVVDMVSFTTCSVNNTATNSPGGGNAYGGGVSVYMGAYAVGFSVPNTIIAAGDTTVQNVSIVVHKVAFTSCNVSTNFSTSSSILSGNTYGGSFSFYVGAYTWSFIGDGSKSGLTTATALSLTIIDTNSTDCSAVVQGYIQTLGANSYGGSISAVYIGAYAWNLNLGGKPGSIDGVSYYATCGDTSVTDLVISITGSTFINSLAASRKFSTCYFVLKS